MRIQNKFLVPTLVLTGLSLVGFGVFFFSGSQKQEEARLTEKMALTEQVLTEGSRDLLWNLDQAGLDALAGKVQADPDIVRVHVFDLTGTISADVRSEGQSDVIRQLDILYGNRPVGKAEIVYSRAGIQARLQGVIFMFSALVALLLGGLLASYRVLAGAVAQPVRQIVDAMKQVNQGELSTRLDLHTDDEFDDVEKCFNEMVEEIESTHLRETKNRVKLEEQASLLESEIKSHEFTGEALRQAQKMEAIARLSGGVAHDFNNLLTSILGFGAMAQDQLDEHDQAYADIEEVLRAGERARDLTQQLLALGRKRHLEMRPIDVNAVVTGLDSLLRRTIGADVELVTVLDETMGSVSADDIALQQVIVNLAVNARDAMPHGGKLTIATEEVFLEKENLADLPDIDPGSYAKISVSDTGVGMSDDVKNFVFEPFFTTKKEGKGTGLGLATVHGIVRQCKGAIAFNTVRGKGTEFRFYLPIDSVEADTMTVRPVEEVVGGSETVLLVEDEDSVRRLTYRILKELGYNVLQARYGTEGLQVAREYEEPIDLILSDVVMPQMSGPDMVQEIKNVRSGHRVLFMSGFTQDRIASTDDDGFPTHLILKPFTRDVLARRIRDVLDEDRTKQPA